MPARFLGGLDLRAIIGCWRRLGMATPGLRRLSMFMLSLVVAILVAWFIDWRLTELLLGDLLARASDQVELGLLPRVTPEDFEPPYTQAKLDALDARLDPLLDRAREPGSGVIRVDLFARDGTVLYSDLASLQSRVVSPLADPRLAAALAGSVSLPAVIRTGLVRLDPGGDAPVAGASARRASGRLAGAAGTRTSECWLSRREMEVLQLLATNRTYRDIAGELSLSEETVRSHVKSILHKLGQPDRARAVAAGVRAGIVRT